MTEDGEERESSGLWALAAGLALGALVGGALGLLFSPKTGAETREDLKGGARKLLEDLQCAAREVTGAVQSFLSEQRGRLRAAVEAGREGVRERGEELKRKLRE